MDRNLLWASVVFLLLCVNRIFACEGGCPVSLGTFCQAVQGEYKINTANGTVPDAEHDKGGIEWLADDKACYLGFSYCIGTLCDGVRFITEDNATVLKCEATEETQYNLIIKDKNINYTWETVAGKTTWMLPDVTGEAGKLIKVTFDVSRLTRK
jgi:hypothetical protein